MFFKTKPSYRRGQKKIKAGDLNRTATDAAQTITLSPPLEGMSFGGAFALRMARVFGIYIIKTKSGIVAATSGGAVPGVAPMTIMKWNGTQLVADRDVTGKTFNPGTPPAADKYGFAIKLFGIMWLGPTIC